MECVSSTKARELAQGRTKVTPATSTLLGRRFPRTRWKKIVPSTARNRVSRRIRRGEWLTSENFLDPVSLERLWEEE